MRSASRAGKKWEMDENMKGECDLDLGDEKKLLGEGEKRKYQLISTAKLENSSKSHLLNKYVVACALLASLNSVLLGYDIGIMSGAVLFIKEDLKLQQLQEEMLVGSLNLVSLVGALIAGRTSDLLGRKKTMTIASIIFLVGAITMGLSPSFFILMIGRLVAGIGVGFGLMIAPVYTAELSPPGSRGALVSFPEVFINLGILIGYIVSYLLSGLPTNINWRLMLGIGALPALMLAVGVLFMPESPRWLIMQNRISEAEEILLRSSNNKEEADDRLAEIVAAATGVKNSQGAGVWRELFCPIPAVRRMLVVALGVQFFQQASGIEALVYYSPTVFKEAGISSNEGVLGTTVAVGFTKTIFILVATVWLDRVGRRPLLLISSLGMTVSLLAIASGFLFLNVQQHEEVASFSATTGLFIIAICSFMIFFSVGFGPVCMVLTSEVFPLALRAQAVSLALVVNRLVSGTVALSFLSMSSAITTAGTFFFFSGVGAASSVFVYVFVPETKGKSLEQIGKIFQSPKELYFPEIQLNAVGGVDDEYSGMPYDRQPIAKVRITRQLLEE